MLGGGNNQWQTQRFVGWFGLLWFGLSWVGFGWVGDCLIFFCALACLLFVHVCFKLALLLVCCLLFCLLNRFCGLLLLSLSIDIYV